MEKRKLTLIGAGSVSFTRGLISDLLNNPCGFDWHISLVDIDGAVLDSIARLVKKMIDHKKSGATLSYTTDRVQALPSSDYVVVTSDNPRSEDPAGIVADICKGLPADFSSSARKANLATIIDRREAIFHAVKQARSGDCILIAGKGHEDYQIFADGTIAFDDREVAREALLQRKGEQEAQNHKTQGHSNV